MPTKWLTRIAWTVWVLLLGISLLTLWSIENVQGTDGSTVFKQALWATLSLLIGIILIAFVPVHRFLFLDRLLYGLSIALMVLALVAGREVHGARAWLAVGPLAFQPVELAKVATGMVIARLTRMHFPFRWREIVIAGILTALPAGLALLQNDTGSALTFAGVAIGLVSAGMPLWLILTGVAAYAIMLVVIAGKLFWVLLVAGTLAATALLFWRKKRSNPYQKLAIAGALLIAGYALLIHFAFHDLLKPHQQQRLLVLTGQLEDPRGASYHVVQVRRSIISGGIAGRGIHQVYFTRFHYIPAQRTDFIFTTIAEAWGWLGATLLLILYGILLTVLWQMGITHRDGYVRVLAGCFIGFFLVHIVINIGMQVQLFPIIGIPLPLVSYGGSQCLAFSLMIALLIALHRHAYELIR